MIYASRRYTSTVEGSIIRQLTCPECHTEFVYLLRRRVTGTGTSPYFLDNEGAANRAENSARKKLDKALHHEHDSIPCPNCGTYHPDIVRFRKRKHLITLMIFFFVSLLVLILAAAFSDSFTHPAAPWAWPSFYGLVLLHIALAIWLKLRDHNTNARSRVGLQLPNVMLKHDFDQMMAEQAAQSGTPTG